MRVIASNWGQKCSLVPNSREKDEWNYVKEAKLSKKLDMAKAEVKTMKIYMNGWTNTWWKHNDSKLIVPIKWIKNNRRTRSLGENTKFPFDCLVSNVDKNGQEKVENLSLRREVWTGDVALEVTDVK